LPRDGNEGTGSRWSNTDAFQVAPQFALGNISRNPVRGPGYRNVDLALLGAPNGVLGSPGFGSITSAGDPRVIQLGLKVIF
jgi:hypothetical protein